MSRSGSRGTGWGANGTIVNNVAHGLHVERSCARGCHFGPDEQKSVRQSARRATRLGGAESGAKASGGGEQIMVRRRINEDGQRPDVRIAVEALGC